MKGSRAAGIRYERKVTKRLKQRVENGLNALLFAEQWIEFSDANGQGYAQPDVYFICPGFILLLECKLSQTDYAFDQMTKLYMPLLAHIYEVPIIPVQVCKHLRFNPPNLIHDISELYNKPRHGLWTWHYLAHH